MIKPKKVSNKQQIISEYLNSKATFLQLQQRHGVPARTIQSWVRVYRKHHPQAVHPSTTTASTRLNPLEQQLQQLTLKNQLLEQIICLAKEHTGIDIAKKYGTRQS